MVKKVDIMNVNIYMEVIYGDFQDKLHQKLVKKEESNQLKFFENKICFIL